MRASPLALGILALCGCGNPTGEACRAYVERFSELECTDGLEPGVDCRVYDDYPCDASAYFACVSEQQACEDGALNDGFAPCAALAACP